MAPKIKITKEAIVTVAVDIVRENGSDALNARSLASALRCSTQPIFSNFSSMEELQNAVIAKAEELSREYIERETERSVYPSYKASGMAYIRFAKEEPELFRLLYMRDRTKEAIPAETDLGNQMETMVRNNTGLKGDRVKLFHFEMWAFVHGIATMLATDYLPVTWDLVSTMLTDVYQGLKKRYETEE